MAVGKHVQFEDAPLMEHSTCTKTHRRRKSLIAALGGIALLSSGFAAGMGVNMYCNSSRGNPGVLGEYIPQSPLSPISPTSPMSPVSPINPLSPRRERNPHVIRPSRSPNKSDPSGDDYKEDNGNKYTSTEVSYNTNDKSDKNEKSDKNDKNDKSDKNEKRAGTWQPAPGASWTYQLSMIPTAAQLANPREYDIWDIDLFDTPATSIKTIQNAGSKVICYFSAGTYEEWRTDGAKFKVADKGNQMTDWAGETWIQTNSANVRKIMAARLDLAKSKGCDGVDPDNIDAYNHDTGFGLTQADATNYVQYLATEANKRGLSIGLKNSGEIIPGVLNSVNWSVNEQCAQYEECDVYKPFIAQGKPVFHVEYPKGDVSNTKNVTAAKKNYICGCIKDGFSPIIKNNNLNSWIQKC